MFLNDKNTKKYLYYWLITMFGLVSGIIVVGGLTRLTDSGLSITEWELFKGLLPPLSSSEWIYYFDLYKKIPEYKLQNFNMSLDEFKIIFWWEWFHRFLGRLIGIFFLIPLIYFTLKMGIQKTISFHIIFILICFQGVVGWFMVSSGLVNRVDVSHFRLSLHLTTAFIILSLILWQILKLKKTNEKQNQLIKYNLPSIFLFTIFLQIIIGAFVSGMDAGKIYNTWPLMGNNYFPDDNSFFNLFNLNALSDPSLVQFLHRNLAYVILLIFFIILYFVLNYKLLKFYSIIKILGTILIIQIILGILTILNGAQMLIASMHQISSIALISFSIYFLFLNTKKI
ncbi:COX15/CtaA family protein [Candidatus Pelagibacter sp.]|nr:COX15/CtaA family protein [Candidatus Pelagibacter sp.]